MNKLAITKTHCIYLYLFCAFIGTFLLSSCIKKANSLSISESEPSPTPTNCPTLIPTPEGSVTPHPTKTATPYPTLLFSIGDPCFKSYITHTPAPTMTAPPTRNPPLVLPGNLKIEEYAIEEKDKYEIESLIHDRHRNMGGWWFWPHGGRINGKIFEAKEEDVGISASLGDQEILKVDCGRLSSFPSVITAWVFQEHWIIQGFCRQAFDIFWDGQSLNELKGYQSSFAFQILGGKPFYLYKKNDQVWLNYDNSDVLLGYDEVKLTYCCETYHPPQHYENMITFYSAKGEQLYYVAIGLFDEK